MIKFSLDRICTACPEAYDVYNAETGEKIAYLRLRHGNFTMEYPYDGKIVYESKPQGDGVFDKEERAKEIGKALVKLRKLIEEKDAIEEYNQAVKNFNDNDDYDS